MEAEGERSFMEMFEEEIQALEKKIETWSNFDQLVIFYGSSSIRLWETLESDLAPLNVLNLGFGGSSFGWCIYYYERLFKKIPCASQIIFYCGDNDLDNGLSPERVFAKFCKLKALTRHDFPKTPISVITIKPSPSRNYLQEQIKLTNQLIRRELLGMTKGAQINVYERMLNEKGMARPELYQEDQLHLNEKGYKIWKGEVRKHLGI
jgi:lysophospholipase L1-like esterase